MPDLASISTGTKLVLGAGLLLLIDTFLSWQKVSVDVSGVEVAAVSANAWHGFWGVLLGLLTIALLVWVGLQLAKVDVPKLPVADSMVTLGLGGLILLFALIKNLADDFSTIWSYIGVVLAAAVAAGAWLRSQEPAAERATVVPTQQTSTE